jgi:hypothetical protein
VIFERLYCSFCQVASVIVWGVSCMVQLLPIFSLSSADASLSRMWVVGFMLPVSVILFQRA